MEFERLLIWICFFFCLGLTAGGILVFFRLKERRHLPAVRFLQYFLIMMYAYGFYAMWSDVFFRLLFPMEPQERLIPEISNFLSLIGTPFLLMGLLMLVLWSLRMLHKTSVTALISGGTLALLLLIGLPLLMIRHFKVLLHTEQFFALLMISVLLFTVFQLGFSPVRYLTKKSKRLLLAIMVLSGVIHLPVLTHYLAYAVLELVFIFLFFLVNTVLGAYFMYAGDFPSRKKEDQETLSFDGFVEKYGITAREKEVILEIYQGKTNREIADCLFVTVQTIKDHTHRIYQKTEVKNRNQLASLLRKFENS